MSAARRTIIELEFQNVNNPRTAAANMLSATYTDNEEDAADDFQMEFKAGNILDTSWVSIKPTTVTVKTTKQVEKTVTEPEVINHVVKRGDTLSAIALTYLGKASLYPQIAQENGIKNPDLIYVGQVIRITKGAQVTTTVTEVEDTATVAAQSKTVHARIIQRNWNDTGRDYSLDCGTFEIDSIDTSGPPLKASVKATSIPYTSTLRMQLKSRNWEKFTLMAIAQQIAQESGMQLMYEASYNPEYDKKEQVQQSDIRFLQDLCHAEGMALKVTNLMIVIFDKEEYDNKPVAATIRKGDRDIISWKMGTKLKDAAYTSCHVSYTATDKQQTIEYTYTPESAAGTGQVLEINERVSSTEEAIRLAKKRLREKNAQEFTASFTMAGNVRLVAGIIVEVKGFGDFDRRYRIKSAKHKMTGGYTTDIELVQVLEGY